MFKKLVLFLGIALVMFVMVEIALRKLWGFGGTVLFQADKDFEYIPQPNQERFRFGHKIVYNEYSMRSEPLTENDKCIVLGFGDSVINGGALTDQDSLATTIVEKQLGKGMRFLNISAGSWSADNCAAYLKKYGHFNAKMIILFVSSHDAHDNMTFEEIVDHHESYPSRQYLLASGELGIRYLLPRLEGIVKRDEHKPAENLMINKNGVGFNPGFQFFSDYTKEHNIPLTVCLHAEDTELAQGKFNEQGNEILDFCARNNIKVITGFDVGEQPGDYRDGIHINEKGQKRWAKALHKEIREVLTSCP